MSDLSQQNNESTLIAENTDISLNWGAGKKARGRITAQALQNNRSLPPVRKKKILKVRQQLAEGTYDIEEKLSLAFDQLLENFID
jgi:hypothetical protein